MGAKGPDLNQGKKKHLEAELTQNLFIGVHQTN